MKSARIRINDDGQVERNDEGPSRHEGLKLHIVAPGLPDREMLLGGGSVSIGRGGSCKLRLLDRSVSRRHAELLLLDGQWTVLDCGSQNGTLLNDVLLREPRRLRLGDILRMGSTTIFVAVATTPSASAICAGPAPLGLRHQHGPEAPLHLEPSDLCDTTDVKDPAVTETLPVPPELRERHGPAPVRKRRGDTHPRLRPV